MAPAWQGQPVPGACPLARPIRRPRRRRDRIRPAPTNPVSVPISSPLRRLCGRASAMSSGWPSAHATSLSASVKNSKTSGSTRTLPRPEKSLRGERASKETSSVIFFNVQARMLSCRTACLSDDSSPMEHELIVERISFRCMGPPESVTRMAGAHLPPKRYFRFVQTPKEPLIPRLHSASPCALTRPSRRARRPLVRRHPHRIPTQCEL